MRTDDNLGSELHYYPNSYGNWESQLEHAHDHQQVYGDINRWDFRADDDDYYTQPGLLFNIMGKEEQQRLFDNTARAMGDAEEHIKLRHIEHCYYADPAYGRGVAKAAGLEDKADWDRFEANRTAGKKGAAGDLHDKDLKESGLK